jgi:hypothetical protein
MKMPMKNDREYRSMPLVSTSDSENENENKNTVEGYATTYDTPYLLYEVEGVKYYEKVARGALDGADLSDVIMQYDHTGKVLARKSNGTLKLDPDDPHGLKIEADLSKSTEARSLYEEIKNGLITQMSWGFIVQEDTYDRATHTRTINKIKKVFDVSAVSIPANDGTEICARSYVNGVLDVEKREALERRKQKIRILCNI